MYARTGERLETHPGASSKKTTKKQNHPPAERKMTKSVSFSQLPREVSLETEKLYGSSAPETQRARTEDNVRGKQIEDLERQRERIKRYYEKAAKNLQKMMAELER